MTLRYNENKQVYRFGNTKETVEGRECPNGLSYDSYNGTFREGLNKDLDEAMQKVVLLVTVRRVQKFLEDAPLFEINYVAYY